MVREILPQIQIQIQLARYPDREIDIQGWQGRYYGEGNTASAETDLSDHSAHSHSAHRSFLSDVTKSNQMPQERENPKPMKKCTKTTERNRRENGLCMKKEEKKMKMKEKAKKQKTNPEFLGGQGLEKSPKFGQTVIATCFNTCRHSTCGHNVARGVVLDTGRIQGDCFAHMEGWGCCAW